MQTFYLLGTDARYRLLAEKIISMGGRVFFSLHPITTEKAFFFLPMSIPEKEAANLLESIPPKSIVLMAKSTPKIMALAKEKSIRCAALFDFESYYHENSTSTAEGTLAEMIQKTDRRLSELCVLVFGYGNCGQAIARLLWLCGCEVWVCSRERGNKKAEKAGFNLYPANEKGFSIFDCVINTVPEAIFSESLLTTLSENAHFFQIASGLSGICPETISGRGAFFHPLPGLPGKVAPASEADQIFEIILSLLKEEKERRS